MPDLELLITLLSVNSPLKALLHSGGRAALRARIIHPPSSPSSSLLCGLALQRPELALIYAMANRESRRLCSPNTETLFGRRGQSGQELCQGEALAPIGAVAHAPSSYQSKWEMPRLGTSANLEYGEERMTGEAQEERKESLNVWLQQPRRRFPISEDAEMELASVKGIRYGTEPSLGSP